MSLNQLLSKPYSLCWLFAAIAILMSLGSGEENVDVNIYDTYFVISSGFLSALVTFGLGFLGMVYWLMERLNKKLYAWLTRIHLAITLGGLLLIGILSFIRSFRAEFGEIISRDAEMTLDAIIWATVGCILLAQLTFLLNILRSALRSE